MADVRLELTTNDLWSVDDATCEGIIVHWATGKRLTNRIPKLSLITLSPPLNSGILGLRMGPYVPTPMFFTICGDPVRAIYQILDVRKYAFLEKAFSWWT